MILLIGANKGGVGKSTVATNLATLLAKDKKVFLCDADIQQSLLLWNGIRHQENLQHFDSATLYGNIAESVVEISKDYDVTIIDVAGRNSEEFLSSLSICDCLISPIQSTQVDLNTLAQLNEQVELMKEYNPKLINHSYVLHNRATTNVFIQDKERADIVEYLDYLPNLKLLKSIVSERKIFKDAFSEGRGINDYADQANHDKALAEFENLLNEIKV